MTYITNSNRHLAPKFCGIVEVVLNEEELKQLLENAEPLSEETVLESNDWIIYTDGNKVRTAEIRVLG